MDRFDIKEIQKIAFQSPVSAVNDKLMFGVGETTGTRSIGLSDR